MIVSMGGFAPGTGYTIVCKNIINSAVGEFGSYGVTTDGSGAATSSGCSMSTPPPGSHEFALVFGPEMPSFGLSSNHYQF